MNNRSNEKLEKSIYLELLEYYNNDFKKEVLDELNLIKEKASKKEINRLDFNKFHPTSKVECIYGQMTGHCESRRAKNIMGKKYSSLNKNFDTFSNKYFTPLEVYIACSSAKKNEKVIQYLKNKINNIEL